METKTKVKATKRYHLSDQPNTNFKSKQPRYNEPHNYYKIIEGVLSLPGRQPDGDSVAFIPKNVEHLKDLYRGYLLKPSNRDGSVQLRLEGIDTPELHYGGALQPLGLEAREELLLTALGYSKVNYKSSTNPNHPDTTVESSIPKTITAFVASNALEPHGRPIAYLFMGDKYKDGQMLRIDDKMVEESVNYQMLLTGFAYLLAYSSMPASHYQVMKEAANKARAAKRGVWKDDATNDFKLDDLSSVEGINAQLVYPKIFRRCVDYFKAVEKGFEGELIDWLISKGTENDQVLINEKTIVPMSGLINQVNDHISFQADTNDIVFIEK